MRPLLTFMSALAVAVTLLLPTTVTSSARDRGYSNLTINVDYRRGGRRHFAERRYRGDRHYGRSHYRGSRHYGPRYRYGRRHRGPSVGIIIGGGVPYYRPAPRYIAPPVIQYRPAYGGSSHVAWCHSRYRSYRAYDNTFQPYHGPRRLCVSPY